MIVAFDERNDGAADEKAQICHSAVECGAPIEAARPAPPLTC